MAHKARTTHHATRDTPTGAHHEIIRLICISTWILCALFFAGVAFLAPKDIETLRSQMRERAEQEQARQKSVR